MSDAIDIDARPRKIEYCCPICLHSVMASDLDRPPHCWRGHGRMEPDSNEPQRARQPMRRVRVMAAKPRE
jgi:hypothetical protein